MPRQSRQRTGNFCLQESICLLISRQGGSDIRPLFDFLHFASEFFYFELNLDRSRFLAFLEHLFWFLLYFRYAHAQPVFRLV
jgi:hypothetical protein